VKFRKRPIVVEANQYDPAYSYPIDGLCFCVEGGTTWAGGPTLCGCPHVHTLEGILHVSPGDWIIKGVNGEFYPCKPDIFAKTYEEPK